MQLIAVVDLFCAGPFPSLGKRCKACGKAFESEGDEKKHVKACTGMKAKRVKACGGGCGCTSCSVGVGDGVKVDGLPGRGVVTQKNGNRLQVTFRSGQIGVWDQRAVHKL